MPYQVDAKFNSLLQQRMGIKPSQKVGGGDDDGLDGELLHK